MTFSIVAYDPTEQAWGVAVASKFIAVGAVVSWARAGSGAVATQSYCKVSFGVDGLALMGAGKSASDTLAQLLAADDGRDLRQVGIVDVSGGAAAHTGSACYAWAGHHIGEGFTCQGNILTGADVIGSMAAAYRAASGELADRLMVALAAGDSAGGDKRGRQGAAVLVVKANGGYGGDNDRYLDVRVDDDPNPMPKLASLVRAHHLFFGAPHPEDTVPITEALARELQAMMVKGGYWKRDLDGIWGDDAKTAFDELIGSENLEGRWQRDNADQIDRVALDYLRERLQ